MIQFIALLLLMQPLKFDEEGRNWIFAGKAKTGESTFIPEGETLGSWTELFVVHHESQSRVPLEKYAHTFIDALNKKESGLINSKILQSDDSSLVFEWWMDADIPNAQHGLVKIYYTGEGLAFMRYTTKAEAIKPIWYKIFSDTFVDLAPSHVDVVIDWTQDPRKWTRQPIQNIELYTQEDGTERVNVEEIVPTPKNLREYYEKHIETLEKKIPNLNTRIVFDTGDRILYEWWYVTGKTNVHEWILVSKENYKAAVAVRHRTVSDNNIDNRRIIWEKILKNVKVNVTYNYKPEKELHESHYQIQK